MNSPLPPDQRVVKFRQIFRRHGQIGVEDHQHIAARFGKALAHGVALALAGLLNGLDVVLRIGALHPLHLLPGAVAAVAFDEDDLNVRAEARNSLHGGFDIAALVAAGDHDRSR